MRQSQVELASVSSANVSAVSVPRTKRSQRPSLRTIPPLIGSPQFRGGSVRTLFVSDVHLGSAYCQPKPLMRLLRSVQPEKLYLVGDFCDGWLLRRNWRWQSEYAELVEGIQSLNSAGTQVHYLLGNHDRCLQRWVSDWTGFQVSEKIVHSCSDGRKMLIIHGDQFDGTQKQRFKGAACMSALFHERMLGGSRIANRLLAGVGVQRAKLATALTTPLKSIAHSVSQFWGRAASLAKSHGCDGVLCGHTHAPLLREASGLLMANTGDWLEHCSAIIETHSGQLELWIGDGTDWLATARRAALVPRHPEADFCGATTKMQATSCGAGRVQENLSACAGEH